MNIRELELFDLFGDGTLVMKTNLDGEYENVGYTWYVEHKGKVIYKGQYQVKPFAAFRLPHQGEYKVKAFVRQKNGERLVLEQTFEANHKTSPKLAAEEENLPLRVHPSVEHISGGFWQFGVNGSFAADAKFAWYIYQVGATEPLVKSAYAPEQTYVHKFTEAGTYRVKVFILVDGVKRSAISESFVVEG